jgi:hypothetical protein
LPLALASGLLLAGCPTPQRQQGELPAGPQVVEIELRDYSFGYDAEIAGGRVLFRIRNTGQVPHTMTVLPLSDEIPPIDEQLRGARRRAITPLARIRPAAPGTRTSFAVNLAPGARYAFVCFLDDTEGTPHWARGMSSDFRATGAPASTGPTSLPE